MPGALDRPFLIVGEGKDEVECFESLLKHLGISEVQSEQYGGKQRLADYLRDLPGRANFRRLRGLCITRDVDHAGEDFYQAVADILRSINTGLQAWPCPTIDNVETIVQGPKRLRVGVYLMPGQGRDGALEDLFLEALDADPATECIRDFFGCLDASGIVRPSSKTMLSKAKIHAWLASREVADLARLGLASKDTFNYVPWEHAAFDPLKIFLRELFDNAPITP